MLRRHGVCDQLALPMQEQSWRCREPDLAGLSFVINDILVAGSKLVMA